MKAFPQNEATMHIDLPLETQQGMDLRDYFAAKAMPMAFKFAKDSIENDGGIFEIGDPERDGDMSSGIAVVAEYCYIFADAMLEARNHDS
jgi:hypothetical protein